MANEVRVIEAQMLRGQVPLLVMPPLTAQTLSIDGAASAAFNKSTEIVRIYSTTACNLCFSPLSGATPTSGDTKVPIAANIAYDFSVRGGTKVIAVS